MSRQYHVRPMVCGLYLELDRAPSLPHLRARLSALVDVFPRLRQRIIMEPGTDPWWQEAREFRLDDQLVTRALPDGQQHIALVARLASRMRERLDPALPPWQLCVWSGATCHGLWLRWHHALSDGEGMLQLLGALADSDAEPEMSNGRDLRRLSPALRGEFESHARGSARMRALALLWKLARQRQVSSQALGSDDFRVMPILERLDSAALSRLRARWSVSTNELLVGLAAGAVARCERRLGRSLPSLRVLSPISDRDGYTDVRLGNFSRALRPTIELLHRDSESASGELLARARTAMREQIEHGQAAPYGVYRLVFALPGATRDRLLGKVARHIVNYMPWASAPQWIAGARVDRLHGFTPMLPFHGCTFACSSYLGDLHANLVYDAALLEHPELLVECLHETLDDALRDA